MAMQAPPSSTEKMPEITSADQAGRLLLQGQILTALCDRGRGQGSEENERKREQSRARPFPSQTQDVGQAETARGNSFIVQNLPKASYDPFLGI